MTSSVFSVDNKGKQDGGVHREAAGGGEEADLRQNVGSVEARVILGHHRTEKPFREGVIFDHSENNES